MPVRFFQKLFSHILFSMLLLCVLSCGGGGEQAAETSPAPPESGGKSTPARIISMAPSITEIVFGLGLGDNVVGVTDFCDYPPEALKKRRIGGVVNPSMETIVALDPDLVLALPSATHESLFRSLRLLGIRVVTLPNDTLDQLFGAIRRIGETTGREAEAEFMTGELRAAIEGVREKVGDAPRRKVMFVVGSEPLFVAGGGTFINEIIEVAGGENIARNSMSKYPQIGIEEIVSRAPDVILYTSLNFELTREQEKAAKKLWSAYPSIPAVKNGEIHGLVADHVTLPGPRLAIGVLETARAIHPEKFLERHSVGD